MGAFGRRLRWHLWLLLRIRFRLMLDGVLGIHRRSRKQHRETPIQGRQGIERVSRRNTRLLFVNRRPSCDSKKKSRKFGHYSWVYVLISKAGVVLEDQLIFPS